MEGFIFSQSGQTIQEILTYVEQRLPGTLQALAENIANETNRAKGRENGLAEDIANETNRATTKENELADAMRGLIPKSEKGQANGVASLNAGGQIPNEQLQWSMRGVLNPSNIDSTSLVAGIYQVNGKVLGPGILDGEQANGVLLQFAWDSRVQVLYVGRAAGASAGEQVEIYVRRYLTGPQRWTAWMTTANFAKKEDIITINERLDDIADDVEHFDAIVPSTASSQNQLADKEFVNHSVATNTANFIGTFASLAELEAYSGPKSNNDYAFVIEQDALGNEYYDRYKYNGSTWLFEYKIESTAFTAAQWAAIQSGITSALVTKLQGLENYDDTAIRNAIALIEQNMVTLNGDQTLTGRKIIDNIAGFPYVYYNVAQFISQSTNAKKHISIRTNIPTNSLTIPEIHILGYNYKTSDFIDLHLSYYIISGKYSKIKLLNNTGIAINVYLYNYLGDDNKNYTAIGLEGIFEYCGFIVNVSFLSSYQAPSMTNRWPILSDNIEYTPDTPTEQLLIPPVGVDKCVLLTPSTNPLYASKSQYDALVKRVAALEQQVNP